MKKTDDSSDSMTYGYDKLDNLCIWNIYLLLNLNKGNNFLK